MKLIVGLGNPGNTYTHTRHNVGFLALDEVVNKLKNKPPHFAGSRHTTKLDNRGGKIKKLKNFKYEKKFDAEILQVEIDGEKILLAKPQTFMNNSGEAVRKIAHFYKIDPTVDVFVLHDDVDIPLGDIRIKKSGSSAGHNGVQSIIDHFGTDEFTRVRIGVGRPPEGVATDVYVLQDLRTEEQKIVRDAILDTLRTFSLMW